MSDSGRPHGHCREHNRDREWCVDCLRAERDGLRDETVRLRTAWAADNHVVEQALGRVLGYPRYVDDQGAFPSATEADGVCTGDHVPETLAMEAVRAITDLRAKLTEIREVLKPFALWAVRNDSDKVMKGAPDEAPLWAAFGRTADKGDVSVGDCRRAAVVLGLAKGETK